ncbi:MAG: hypothetical protein QMB25_03030 [Pseudomonadales bacterium]
MSNTKSLVQNAASSEKYVRLANADTNRSLNIERADGALQFGKPSVRYRSANYQVGVTPDGHASCENRWSARRHRFYVPEDQTSGVARNNRLDKFDSMAEWTFQPAYEGVKDFELIPF